MNTTLKMIITFVAGTGAGLVAGYLTAPKSGKESRDAIKGEFDSRKDEIEKLATEKLHEAKAILNEAVEKQAKNGKRTIDRAKEKILLS